MASGSALRVLNPISIVMWPEKPMSLAACSTLCQSTPARVPQGEAVAACEMDVAQVAAHRVDVVGRDLVAIDRMVGVEHHPDIRQAGRAHQFEGIVAGR